MDEHDLDCRRCVDLGLRPVGQMVQRADEQLGLYEASEMCSRCYNTLKKAATEQLQPA